MALSTIPSLEKLPVISKILSNLLLFSVLQCTLSSVHYWNTCVSQSLSSAHWFIDFKCFLWLTSFILMVSKCKWLPISLSLSLSLTHTHTTQISLASPVVFPKLQNYIFNRLLEISTYISCVRVHIRSCLTLCSPIIYSLPASLSVEFPRQEYWSGLPFPTPRDLPNPGIIPCLLHLLHW